MSNAVGIFTVGAAGSPESVTTQTFTHLEISHAGARGTFGEAPFSYPPDAIKNTTVRLFLDRQNTNIPLDQ